MNTVTFPGSSRPHSPAFQSEAHPSVIAFRSRNPIQVADRFARELADPTHVRTINCNDCQMQGSAACTDCVVTYVLATEPGRVGFELSAPEVDTLSMLQASGLAPKSQFVARPLTFGTRRTCRTV